MKKVGVVILNYKLKDEVGRCVKSVFKSDYPSFEVILVDNNSNDHVEDVVRNLPVHFIQAGLNLGFSGGVNIGIKKAIESGAEYVFLLNPDAWIVKSTISKLVEAFNDDKIGIAGPKVYFPDGKTILYAGGIFDKANVLGSHRGVDEKDIGQFDEYQETDFVSGGAMMINCKVFEKVGYLDPKYFLYLEDLDFCVRVKNAGFLVVYVPEAVAYHESGKITGIGSPLQDYYITRNRMIFAMKHLPIRTQLALFREGLSHITKPVRRKALFDFWLGKHGGPRI